MELLKLIKTSPNGEKAFYILNAEINNNKYEITLAVEKGIIGQRKRVKFRYLIKEQEIKLSSKKGIDTLIKYAKELGNKIYLKKRKEGYDIFTGDDKILKEDNGNDINNSNNNKEEKNKEDPQLMKDDDSINEDKDTFIPLETMIKPYYPVTPKFYYPMLCYPYEKKKKEIKYPCYVQPKLDGVRCVAVHTELFSRHGNPFPTLSHIKEELLKNTEHLLLDGELYSEDFNFEKIISLVKKKNKTAEEEKRSLGVYMNVFDYIEPSLTFEQRISNLNLFFKQNSFKYIRFVKTEKCFNEKEVMDYLEKYSNQGYEGLIIRNMHGKYEPTVRSIHVQKIKKFIINEFKIIDYTTPPSGKEHGSVIWICQAPNGRLFNVKPLGTLYERKKLYADGKKYVGKLLRVKYQQFTHDGVPRFGVGISIKE